MIFPLTTSHSLILTTALVLLSSFSVTGCASVVTVATPQLEIPATYSDIPVTIRRHFERTETTTHSGWASADPSAKNLYLEEILKQELAQTPGAKGIKNLRVRYYNPWLSTFQFFNVFGYLIGVGARSGIMYGLIYRTKELEVSGDIY